MPTIEIPLPAQTTYAELLDLCEIAAFENAFPEEGSFSVKTQGARRYWYFQPPEKGHPTKLRAQRYVGPETPELLARIERHRQQKESQALRRKLVVTLTRTYGLSAPLPAVGTVVAGLAKAGMFRLRGVLAGTVAFQTYPALLGSRFSGAMLQTGDVDMAQFLNVSVAVGDQTEPMLGLLKQIDLSFRKVPSLAREATTRYVSRKVLRVEFLVPNQGAESDKPMRLPALQTEAEPLRFLDFLIYQPVQAVLLHGPGVLVTVPAPERFAVHKLILAQRRHRDAAKSRKDIRQAETLLQILADKRPEDLKLAWQEAWSRGPSWRAHLTAGWKRLPESTRLLLLNVLPELSGSK